MKKRAIIICIVLFVIIPNFFMPLTKMTHLSDEEIGGMDTLYEENDTVLFISESGDMDTMRIFEKYVINSLWPFTGIEWFEGFDERIASIIYGADIQHSGKVDRCSWSIAKYDNRRLPKFDTYVNNLSSEFAINRPYDSVLVNNLYIPEGWSFDTLNTETNVHFVNFNIESFVWSKSLGLVTYKYVDGERYYLKDLETKIRAR